MVPRKIASGFYKSFSQLIHDKFVYVDKTKAACLMAEREECYLLTRPRRMGKSTMVSTLEYLFSKGTVGTEGLYCYDHWPETQRYFVFKFVFSLFDITSIDSLRDKFRSELKNYAGYFGVEISQDDPIHVCFEQLVAQSVKKLSDKSFLADHPELQDGDRPLCTDKVVLLIDEYDTPLTHYLETNRDPHELQEFYCHLFATIKKIGFRFVFVTGISSYEQSSIFGSPNQFIDISLDPRYATCCGYTQEELEHYFAPELENAQQEFNLSRDELMNKLSYYYGGYFFNSLNDGHNDTHKLFNTVSVSSFLSDPSDGFDNYWANTGGGSDFLLKLIFLSSQEINRQLLRKSYKSVFDSLDLSDPKVNEFIEAWSLFFLFELFSHSLPQDKDRLLCKDADSLKVDLSEDELFTTDNAIAILYQAGYLAIKHVDDDKVYLGLANYDATSSLALEIDDERNYINTTYYNLAKLLASLEVHYYDIFERLQKGTSNIGWYFQGILNTVPQSLLTKDGGEKQLAFFSYWVLKFQAIVRKCDVKLDADHVKIIIYQPHQGELADVAEDIVIEFKLANSQEELKQLKAASLQPQENDSDKSPAATDPYRYCVLIGLEQRLVASISAINADGSSNTVYVSDRLNEDGTVQNESI